MTERKNIHVGTRRAAILLMSLDEDTAANVMRFLPKDAIPAITMEMSRTNDVSNAEMKQILELFMSEIDENTNISLEDNEQLRSLLTKAIGAEKAESIIDDVMSENQNEFGMEKLNHMDSSVVADMIREEHPQIITAILVHLDRDTAGAILSAFDETLRNDVLHRIANFNGVQREALQELTEVLSVMLDGQNMKRSTLGGIKATAEILNTMATSLEESALGSIRSRNEDLAQRIQDEMFVFENLIDVDESGIQLLLGEIDQNALVIALKGASEALRDKFVAGMSTRGAELFMEDLESRGPVRVSQVEAEQKGILNLVRQMMQRGDIILGGSDDGFI